MISPETQIDVLAEIARHLDRIASGIDLLVKAAVREPNTDPHIELFATTHEA